MNTEELTEVVTALHQLCMAQAGKIAALETVSDAVVAAVGMAFPPLIGELSKHIEGLACYNRDSVGEDSVSSYEAKLAEVLNNLRVLQGR